MQLRRRFPLAGNPFDSGAAGVPEAQKTGHFVECLPGGVVQGLAEQAGTPRRRRRLRSCPRFSGYLMSRPACK